MIIDTMDLLYTHQFDSFGLISSDSDFTRLAMRIREAGVIVYGFGERKTPTPFVTAYNRFIYVENLVSYKEHSAASPIFLPIDTRTSTPGTMDTPGLAI